MLSLGLTAPRANLARRNVMMEIPSLCFDGSMGLFRRLVASRKKMRIKGGVTTKHLRRNASTRYLSPSVLFRGEFALMTRLARMVVSGLPQPVTQRGNRRKSIFFEDGDREIYRDLLGEQARKADVEV